MRDALIAFAGGTAALGAVALFVVGVGVVIDLVGPRHRTWICEEARPGPVTPEDWRRICEASSRASAARRAS